MFLIIVFFSFITSITFTNKKYYTIVMSLFLFVISSIRSVYYGSDTIGYVNKYLSLKYLDYSYIISNNKKDPYFYLLSKFISDFGFGYRGYLIILAAIFILSIYYILLRDSKYPKISILVFITLGYYYFSMTGLRQSMAMVFTLLSFRYLLTDKILKFLVMVLIGSLFHTTALIFLIAYPISKMKFSKKNIIVVFVILLFIIVNDSIIYNYLSYLSDTRFKEYLISTRTLNYSGFIIQFLIFTFNYYFHTIKKEENNDNNLLLSLTFFGLILQTFSSIIAEFFRLSMYFSIFNMLLIPDVIYSIENKRYRQILRSTIIIIFVIYGIYSSVLSGYSLGLFNE